MEKGLLKEAMRKEILQELSEERSKRWFSDGMTLQERVEHLLEENERLRQENAKFRKKLKI